MNRIILTILLIAGFCFSGLAQHGKGEGRGKMFKKIEAQKISFITQELALTPEEAQIFWPVYNEFQTKKRTLRNDTKTLLKRIRNGLEGIPDDELVQISDDLIEFRSKDILLEKEYHTKLKKVLPIQKVLKLYHAEKQFQHILLRSLKEKRHRMERHQVTE